MVSTYFITTLGCPKNQADSRAMERSLLRNGFAPAATAELANYHLINSCSFIESARVETIQTVFEAAGLKRQPDQRLILAGCFSERYSDAVQTDLPEVDLHFGTGRYHHAGEIIGEAFGRPTTIPGEYISMRPGRSYAPVKISDGCNRGCAFCAIPGFRGAFQSTPRNEIVAEVHSLVSEGVREVCLVSQDTNQYGRSVESLLDLIEELHGVPGLTWIRLLYLYPDLRTEQIFRGIKERGLNRVVPYLESPVQHASDGVLRSMRRAGGFDFFLSFFDRMRRLIPDLEIRTSLLVGFPGEEESDVRQLHEFVRTVRPEKLALFSYSPEEGTPGFELGDPIDEKQKSERINGIRETHLEVLKEIHMDRVGKTYECMLDEWSEGRAVFRRAQDAPEVDEVVYVDALKGDWKIGDTAQIEITGFLEYDMLGQASQATVAVSGVDS